MQTDPLKSGVRVILSPTFNKKKNKKTYRNVVNATETYGISKEGKFGGIDVAWSDWFESLSDK